MNRSQFATTSKIGLILGVVGAGLGVAIAIGVVLWQHWQPGARGDLVVRLDPSGPYVILASPQATTNYATAIAKARALHPDATQLALDPADLVGAQQALRKLQPRYALVFLEPQELDVNFAWQWLALTTEMDEDPFVDLRTGFITGSTPAAAADFVDRIAAAARGELKLPGLCIDNLGPNPQAGRQAFQQVRGAFMIPVLGEQLGVKTISHGVEGFSEQRLGSLSGAGLIHLGGHGHPDRVDDGVTGVQVRRLQLSPCVVFNGACYTGVTRRWYDMQTPDGNVAEHTVEPEGCFCLNLLGNGAIAYLAALHPDHGMPVYQEMEFAAYSGRSLGDVIKHTHDGVVLGAGGKLPKFERLAAGRPAPRWSPSDVMLKGTAARVLFGDPALIITEPFAKPPFNVTVREAEGSLRISATLVNTKLKSTYTDTYHADLSSDPNQFNDRALIVAPLPAGWKTVGNVEVAGVQAGGQAVSHRLVGYGVESDNGSNWLQVQVDVPTQGFMQSALRTAGATVELKVVSAGKAKP